MKLLKDNKGKLIASSIVILLPMLFGLLAKKLLPEEIAVHWNVSGTADGFMNSSVVFLVLPAVLLAVHWLCMILTAALDPGVGKNRKMLELTFWIIPAISLIFCGLIFSGALGYASKLSVPVLIILGVTFIVIGNYMPKTTRNLTMGIKLKWTISNDDNWNATHRMAGKVYVATGLVCLLAIPLPMAALPFVLIGAILICCLLPMVYSYRFYQKQLREGTATKEAYKENYGKMVESKKLPIIVSVVITVLLLVILVPVMFTGSIETTLGEESLTVNATYWEDLTLAYEEIDTVEYREDGVDGARVGGFGSAKLLLGGFENDEFGSYTRYTYTGDSPCIVLRVDQRIIVLAAETAESTKALYENLIEKIAE